jgi:hypothetical protein
MTRTCSIEEKREIRMGVAMGGGFVQVPTSQGGGSGLGWSRKMRKCSCSGKAQREYRPLHCLRRRVYQLFCQRAHPPPSSCPPPPRPRQFLSHSPTQNFAQSFPGPHSIPPVRMSYEGPPATSRCVGKPHPSDTVLAEACQDVARNALLLVIYLCR